MTPLEIEILLFYYYCARDYREGDHSAPAVKAALNNFLTADMIKHSNFHVERFDDGTLRARYALTDRGKAYIEALKQVPLPEQIWVVPAQPERRAEQAALS